MSDVQECPECNGFGLIAVAGFPNAWTRATADDSASALTRKRCGRCGATAQGRPVPMPMVLRAELIVVDQWGDEAGDTAPSCATCRWASPVTQEDVDSYREPVEDTFSTHSLACHVGQEFDERYEDWWTIDGFDWRARGVIGWCEGGPRATLIVRPDFGCVQWEAK